MNPSDPRVQQARAVLRELGIRGRVEVRGHTGDIACLIIPADQRAELIGERGSQLAARIRALGFGYVALDLDPASNVH